jgi:hypothetical protein
MHELKNNSPLVGVRAAGKAALAITNNQQGRAPAGTK